MIQIACVHNLNIFQVVECNELINLCFNTNRFEDYKTIIIFVENYKIIGFVGICESFLNQLCIHPSHRNKGIATKLLKMSYNIIKKPLKLYVDKKKETTDYLVSFYKKNGYYIEYENNKEYLMYIN
tara:strand:+ start:3510 stop:3887 length:378 start_codon:yes stop_codon:yes gene_type:complete